MPRNLNISKELEFIGDATHGKNIQGEMFEKKRHDWDRFTGIALDTTNRWATSLPGTSDTIAISEVQGGSALITTGTVDDDSCMLASAIIYSASKKAVCEWRIYIPNVSGVALFVGFSDAKSESNNSIAIHYASDTLTTVASNGAGFVIDPDSTTKGASQIQCEGVKANSDATGVDTGIAWADGEIKTLRVELDGDDNAIFYVDGVLVGRVADAVTSTTLLCATVQAMTRANEGAAVPQVRSYDAWQDD